MFSLSNFVTRCFCLKIRNQINVDEHSLLLNHQVSQTKNDASTGDDTKYDHETWLRLKKLVQIEQISKDYIEDGAQMNVICNSIGDADWNTVAQDMRDKKHPLRELYLRHVGDNNKDSTQLGFIEFTKTIEDHTTLVKLDFYFGSVKRNNQVAGILKALKRNRSIKHLYLRSDMFDLETARAVAQTLMNNQTLLSLQIVVVASPDLGREPYTPAKIGCFVELARSLQTTVLERFRICAMDNRAFEVIIQSLPKTLVHLDLGYNTIDKDSIPILCSYLRSNGSTLKELILDDSVTTKYLKQQKSSSLSTVKIISNPSWQADFLREGSSIWLQVSKMNDSDWSMLFLELAKDHTIYPKIHLSFFYKPNRKQMKYVKTLLSEQFRFKSLTVTAFYAVDKSTQIELFRQLKGNKSITELRFRFGMDSNAFRELVNILTNKTNIIHLDLSEYLDISDEEAILLSHVLKKNTVLQSLVLKQSGIGDIGFQAILSSLPNSISKLNLEDSYISGKSLPSLLDFIKAHPILKEVSLSKNGISSSSSTEINVSDLLDKILEIADANHCICNLEVFEEVKKQIASSQTGDIIFSDLSRLRDDHILELCNELKKEPNRNWSLNLSWLPKISSVGYRHLADILSSSINIVKLTFNNIDMNEEARTIFLNGLRNNKTIKRFDIKNITLNNQDMEYIGHFIQNDRQLREIVFCNCRIDADGAIHLAKCLPESRLEELDLDENSLGDRGCARILSSIPPTLTKLSLNGNQVTKSSLKTIVTVLVTNRTLRKLIISTNPIFEEAQDQQEPNSLWQQAIRASKENNICELV